MEISLSGKRALVTGAGRGIGRELVKRLVECGAEVVALSRGQEALDTLKDELPQIVTVSVDVSDWDATNEAIISVGPIDLLVNNAAILENIPFGDYTEEDFDRTIQINLKAVLNISQVVTNGIKERGTAGSIVNVSSDLAHKAMAGFAIYGATKAALVQLTRVMAVELGPHNIRVNTVHPTLTNTDLVKDYLAEHGEEFVKSIPMGRLCEPSDVVDAIIFLLSDRAAMVHGSAFFVDGGSTTS